MKVVALIVLILIGLGSYIFFDNSAKRAPAETPNIREKVDFKASFVIFTNGFLRDFSEPKYHNQSEDVYITSENPTQVIVKRAGVTWDEFFKTLPSPMKVTKDCLYTGSGQVFCNEGDSSLKFYLNGKLDNEFLTREIKNGDKALISFGSENESEIQTQLKILE
jgi:hypothetical protein